MITGPGTWRLSLSQRTDGVTSSGHQQMAPWPISWGASGLLEHRRTRTRTMVSRYHFLWNIGHCKIVVTCNIDWSSSHYREACAIPDPDTDTVVVTGGFYTFTTVSRYGKQGWEEDFSSGLNSGRWGHGCASFLSHDNERVKFNLIFIKHSLNIIQVLLVTGGTVSNMNQLASTEVYRPSAGEWREVPGGALPRPMTDMGVVTLDNRVLLFGEKILII